MKVKNLPQFLIAMLLLLTFTSCSDDSDNTDNLEAINLIVGEWAVIAQHDYECGTNDIVGERFADPNQVDIYYSDGTWRYFKNGDEYWNGTWKVLSDNTYELYYEQDNVTQTHIIEFDGKDVMKFNLGECYQGTYIYTLCERL